VLSGTGGSSDRYPIVSGVDLIPPVAIAGPDIFIDQNSTVTFNASLSSDNFGIAEFEWSFSYGGEDVLLTGAVTTFTFDIPGFYLVKLVVVDKFNNLANDTLNVTVRDTQPPVVLMDSNVPPDKGGWFELNGSRSWDNVGITSYLWIIDPEALFIVKTGVVVNHTILTPGKYDVVLNVSDAAGNWAVGNLTITLLDIENPIADAGNDIEIDQGMEVTLDGTGSYDNGVIVEYHWNFDDNGEMVDLYGSRPNYRFLVPGTYTITLKVTDSADLVGFDELVVVVLDREAPLARAGDDIEIEQGQIASFNGTDSFDNVGIVTYRWTFEHNATDVVLEGATATFKFEVPGVYNVTLTVIDENNLEDRDELTVTVLDTIAPIADAGSDIERAMGEELTLDGRASSDNVGIVNYTWTVEAFGEELNKTGNVTFFSISDAGTYRVTLTVTDAAGNWANDTLSIVILDTEPPRLIAVMTERIDPGTELEMNSTLSTDNVGVVGTEWTFEYGGEEVKLTGMVVTFTFDIQGDYTIRVRIYDAMGNEDSYNWDLEVSDIESPFAVAGEDIEPILGTTLQVDGTRSTDNIGIVKYEWKIGIEYGPQALPGPTPTVEIDKMGLFFITLTVWDEAGNFASDDFTVNVRPVLAPVRLGPFLDEDGKPLFHVEITMTLNGTVYTRRTNDDGNGTMDVEWYDIPGTAQVHAELEGYEPIDFEVTIDDKGIPNAVIPPMVREEDPSGTSSLHILIAVGLTLVGIVILLTMLMRRR
jgi:PKD repeat protein